MSTYYCRPLILKNNPECVHWPITELRVKFSDCWNAVLQTNPFFKTSFSLKSTHSHFSLRHPPGPSIRAQKILRNNVNSLSVTYIYHIHTTYVINLHTDLSVMVQTMNRVCTQSTRLFWTGTQRLLWAVAGGGGHGSGQGSLALILVFWPVRRKSRGRVNPQAEQDDEMADVQRERAVCGGGISVPGKLYQT